MYRRIHELALALVQKPIHLVLSTLAHHDEQLLADAVNALVEVLAAHPPEALLPLTFSPGSQGRSEVDLVDGREPAPPQALRVLQRAHGVDAEPAAHAPDGLAPAVEGATRLHRAVGRLDGYVELLQLEEAARLQELIGLVDEAVPVGDAHGEGADVDVVEALVKGPGLGGVIDIKGAIDRHVLWLDGRQVRPHDLDLRVQVGKVYGPVARAAAHVEDVRHVDLVDGREVVTPAAEL